MIQGSIPAKDGNTAEAIHFAWFFALTKVYPEVWQI
jgi:hypothetical protein